MTAPSASQLPPGARSLLDAARRGERRVRATYALAEELATGALVHSVAVRIGEGGGAWLGYGVWINGALKSARWGTRGGVGQTELLALAAGEAYLAPAPRAAPVKGPCARCGALVRWRTGPGGVFMPWKHRRAEGGEGGAGQREDCV